MCIHATNTLFFVVAIQPATLLQLDLIKPSVCLLVLNLYFFWFRYLHCRPFLGKVFPCWLFHIWSNFVEHLSTQLQSNTMLYTPHSYNMCVEITISIWSWKYWLVNTWTTQLSNVMKLGFCTNSFLRSLNRCLLTGCRPSLPITPIA
jgi:hypothetical protein